MCVCVCVYIQGLSEAVLDRMSHWQPTEPYTATLTPSRTLKDSDEQGGYIAALQQLTNLPTDTVLSLDDENWTGFETMQRIARALAVAAPALTHVKVLSPAARGRRMRRSHEEYGCWPDRSTFTLRELCDQSPPYRHARVTHVDRDNQTNNEDVEDLCDTWAWPWESLSFVRCYYWGSKLKGVYLSDLLYLPDPTGGQYEISVYGLDLWEANEVRNTCLYVMACTLARRRA